MIEPFLRRIALMSPPSSRSRIRRSDRADYELDTICAILDAGYVAHLGFIDSDAGHPVVIPIVYARVGNALVFHAGRASRLAANARMSKICATVTLIDGLVLAKSAFHHSMNYRSVVAFGRPREVEDPGEKSAALQAFIDKLLPGRWQHVRAPSPKEFAATAIFALPLDEASAKLRAGPPLDDAEDLDLPVEAGVIPLMTTRGIFIPS